MQALEHTACHMLELQLRASRQQPSFRGCFAHLTYLGSYGLLGRLVSRRGWFQAPPVVCWVLLGCPAQIDTTLRNCVLVTEVHSL